MANWFRLCENRHTDRHRQLRIAQGPLPPHLSLLLASLLSTCLHLSSSCLHTHPFSKWKRPVSSLLSVLSSSPGPFFPPSILGAAAGGVGVDSSGWWVEDCVERESQSGAYLLSMQRYGLWILWSLIIVRHHGLISQETAFATACLSCMYMVVSFCQTKGHVHVLYKCQKTNVIILKPLAEWPFFSKRGPVLSSCHPTHMLKGFVQNKAVQKITMFLFWKIL